jgi:hypothetical protein
MTRPLLQEGWSTLHRLFKIADCRQRKPRSESKSKPYLFERLTRPRAAPLVLFAAARAGSVQALRLGASVLFLAKTATRARSRDGTQE